MVHLLSIFKPNQLNYMKKVIFIIFWVVFMTWNFPFVVLYLFLSLWHWDWKYAASFGERMAEANNIIDPFK
jgi:hypothetical protein